MLAIKMESRAGAEIKRGALRERTRGERFNLAASVRFSGNLRSRNILVNTGTTGRMKTNYLHIPDFLFYKC